MTNLNFLSDGLRFFLSQFVARLQVVGLKLEENWSMLMETQSNENSRR